MTGARSIHHVKFCSARPSYDVGYLVRVGITYSVRVQYSTHLVGAALKGLLRVSVIQYSNWRRASRSCVTIPFCSLFMFHDPHLGSEGFTMIQYCTVQYCM